MYLAKYTEEDFPLYYTLTGDERVMAQITERPLSKDEAEENFRRLLRRNASDKLFGSYKIFTDAGVYIGLSHITVQPGQLGEAEIGYMILPEYWGKGYGGQAADLLLGLAEKTDCIRLKAVIDPANTASKRILTKRGFISEWRGMMDGLPGEVLKRSIGSGKNDNRPDN